MSQRGWKYFTFLAIIWLVAFGVILLLVGAIGSFFIKVVPTLATVVGRATVILSAIIATVATSEIHRLRQK